MMTVLTIRRYYITIKIVEMKRLVGQVIIITVIIICMSCSALDFFAFHSFPYIFSVYEKMNDYVE